MTTSESRIDMLDLSAEITFLWDELQAAATRVLRSGRFILGHEVREFESEVADYLGVRHAIGVASGTDALVISLRCLGVGPGDEVITSPFTFVATAEAILRVEATPVFVDIDPRTFNILPSGIESAITRRTKAIIPVHLFGAAAPMDPVLSAAREHGLKLVEDAAQSFGGSHRGRKLGTLGDAGAFSFFPTKNLGGFGDGGLIATDDELTAELARKLRSHGGQSKYDGELIGYNSRLDELHAALLRVKLPHLDQWNSRRLEVAHMYQQLLGDVRNLVLPDASDHVYNQYTIRVQGIDRDAVQAELHAGGVSAAVYYRRPLYELPVYSKFAAELPNVESACGEVLSLPCGPFLARTEIERVTEALRAAVNRAPKLT